jgi:ethanolamine utilization microcompartment shell protein EutL
LGIIECAPAAYISIATNEAEKAAEIDMVEVRAVGRFGRLFISGSENNVAAAIEAETKAIEAVDGV